MTERSFVPLNIAVLTVSDSRGEAEDKSGKLLVERLGKAGHRCHEKRIVRDDIYQIRAVVAAWIADPEVHAVITTGGTGVTGRDGTPEAVQPLLDKILEGFGEIFRIGLLAADQDLHHPVARRGRGGQRHLRVLRARLVGGLRHGLGRAHRGPARQAHAAVQPGRPDAAPAGDMSGTQRMVLVGTQKGLFIARPEGDGWILDGPHIAGYEIIHCCAPPQEPGVIYAAAGHKIWGAHIYRSEDHGRSWASLPTAPQHAVGLHKTALKSIWYLAASPDGRLYAGIDPAGLFYSDDRAATWHPVQRAQRAFHAGHLGAGARRLLAAFHSHRSGRPAAPVGRDLCRRRVPQ